MKSPVFLFELGEGIGLGGDLLVRVFNVCVDLRSVQILVPEHLLQRLQVDAVGKHQRRRRVAELVRGKLCCVQPGLEQVFFDEPMDRADADAVLVA